MSFYSQLISTGFGAFDIDARDDYYPYGPTSSSYRQTSPFYRPTLPSYNPKDKTQSDIPVVYQAKSLEDICCKYLALNFPFGYLQDRCPPVPDDLQLKVITLSFPDNYDKLEKYAKLSTCQDDNCMNHASALCDIGAVTNMMQIGFRLSARVNSKYVTILFDRGKITSVHCSCNNISSWCVHVLAAALMKMREAEKLDIKSQVRLPVSDALNTLSREQLLKFSQYLLYHHQNHKIVETAQGLIDKLVNRHGDHVNDDINTVSGAPDFTAGPGLDEDSHWFVSSHDLKDRFTDLRYIELDELGFVFPANIDRNYQLIELWDKKHWQKALVKDPIDGEIYGPEFYSYSRGHRVDACVLLETILDLLQDGNKSGLIAIISCTEQLLSCLDGYRYHNSSHHSTVTKPFYPSTSPETGFTARPLRSWTLCDELSRLWQVFVLNPKLKSNDREQIAQELLDWNKKVHILCSNGMLLPWRGLEVAYNLCQTIDWSTANMKSILDGVIPQHAVITGLVLADVKLEQETYQCHLPYCFTYGSVTLDIHTWCAIIDTLDTLNYHTAATNIAYYLALALIDLYHHHSNTRPCISDVPIVQRCTLEHKDLKNTADHKNTCTAAVSDDPMDIDVDESSTQHNPCPSIWPSGTLLSLRCFAFLHNILSSNQSIVETLLTRQKNSSTSTQFGAIEPSDSLLFQLGAVGLFLPKFPMSSLRQEKEQYDLENWLSFQLLEMGPPTASDLELLSHLCKAVNSEQPHWPLAPCSSFTRVVLHHTYKELSAVQEDVLQLVLHNLDYCFIQDHQECPWSLYEFSVAVSWCKLAELALSILVHENKTHWENAITCIFNKAGVLGSGGMNLRGSEDHNINIVLLQNVFNAKHRMSLVLAKTLVARIKQSGPQKCKNQRSSCNLEILHGGGSKTCELFPKITSPIHIVVLKKCALRLGVHSAAIEKLSDPSIISHGSSASWLVEMAADCGSWGLRCLLDNHDDITDVLTHDEAIDLCQRLLGEKDECTVNLVKEVLLSLLRQAVNDENAIDVNEILDLCSHGITNDLMLWVCQHLHDIACTKQVHFEVLMVASHEIFKCYKKRLRKTNKKNQRVCNHGGNLALADVQRQVISEEADKDIEDKPCTTSNPYMTESPHPFLELSFDLGMMGVDALPKENSADMRRYYSNQTDHLKNLCGLLCYITRREWLLKKPKDHQDKVLTPSDRLVCDGDRSYLSRFVNDLIKSNNDVMVLMTLLCEIAFKLQNINNSSKFDDDSHQMKQLLRNAVTQVPYLNDLLDRILLKFRDLLLGPVMDELEEVVAGAKRPIPQYKADCLYLESSTLTNTLVAAKKAYGINDSSDDAFKKLVEEIGKSHDHLKDVLDGMLSGEQPSGHKKRKRYR